MEHFILWLSLAFVVFVLGILVWQDWYHVKLPARRVQATVVRHHINLEDGHTSYAAVLGFDSETGAPMQVHDSVYGAQSHRPIGSTVDVTHPIGMPERARVPRPWMRAGIYLVLLYLLGVLVGRLAGWLK